MRCSLTVKLPRRSTVRVEDVAESAWMAFDRCFDRLKRRLASDREKRLKQARYPKKQFAAKRLLEGAGPEAET
jgi:ribosome-associated translation inhibitor RaiA